MLVFMRWLLEAVEDEEWCAEGLEELRGHPSPPSVQGRSQSRMLPVGRARWKALSTARVAGRSASCAGPAFKEESSVPHVAAACRLLPTCGAAYVATVTFVQRASEYGATAQHCSARQPGMQRTPVPLSSGACTIASPRTALR